MFTDRVILQVFAGNGGAGAVAWCREKYRPDGGPYGGNGGTGGSIYIEVDESYFGLDHFRHQKIFRAQNGDPGGSNDRTGKNGEDLILKVPQGTLLKDSTTNKVIYDFTKHKESFCLCKGGVGGKGNSYFKSSINRSPAYATPGKEGESAVVELELKLIADIGLVGFPNAGKSTLLSLATTAKAKIGNYPFTTLTPNLGSVADEHHAGKIVIADIPGIIKDAHKNRGLGFAFLRHIERTSALLFILDASGFEGRNPEEDLQILMHELMAYDASLLNKPFFIALNKVDHPGSEEIVANFKKNYAYDLDNLFEISALTGQGVAFLIERLKRKLIK